MSDWWVDSAYFKFRMPVVVWSSPGLVFPMTDFTNTEEQVQYAATLISGALDYKQQLDRLDFSLYSIMCCNARVTALTIASEVRALIYS